MKGSEIGHFVPAASVVVKWFVNEKYSDRAGC
jgi:hypothetical protein